MPTYVYECSVCEQQFEAQQRITEDPLDTCICGSKGTIKRVIQPIAVVFKGSGFHINDYSPSAAKPSEASEGSTAAAKSPEPAAKTSEAPAAESKPAESKPTESAPATPASTAPSDS